MTWFSRGETEGSPHTHTPTVLSEAFYRDFYDQKHTFDHLKSEKYDDVLLTFFLVYSSFEDVGTKGLKSKNYKNIQEFVVTLVLLQTNF